MPSPSLPGHASCLIPPDPGTTHDDDARPQWSRPGSIPATPGFYATLSHITYHSVLRRVFFTGRSWMSDEPVSVWRPWAATDELYFRPVSHLVERASSLGKDDDGAGHFATLTLGPMSDSVPAEVEAIGRVAMLQTGARTVRLVRPLYLGASGLCTGVVLAVSDNYAAQEVGPGQVAIHERRDLDRTVVCGEMVTLAYDGSKATVYDGLLHDSAILADGVSRQQWERLRLVVLDAVSMLRQPQARVRDAICALQAAAGSVWSAPTVERAALEDSRTSRLAA